MVRLIKSKEKVGVSEMSNHVMKVQSREVIGTNKVKKMRANNIIPGVIYSRNEETRPVSVDNPLFLKVFKEAGTSSVINLDLNGETVPVIVKSVQRHPISGFVSHVDFQKLNMSEKIKLSIPVVLLNRDEIKLQPSILMQLIDQIEVECLPSYIPKTADIDVENMDFTTPMYVKDTDIASMEGIAILSNLDDVVCSLSPPVTHTEVEEDVAESAEVPVIGEEA